MEDPKYRKMGATQIFGKQYESKIENLYIFVFKIVKKSFLHKKVIRDEKLLYYENPVNDKKGARSLPAAIFHVKTRNSR